MSSVKQDLPLTTTTATSSPRPPAPATSATTNPFEFDVPASDSNGVSNPFEFPPPSPTGRRSNPFMDDLSSTSPRRSINPFDFFAHYSSAPSSPARAAALYAEVNSAEDTFISRASFSTSSNVPFEWEERPGTPKSPLACGEGINGSPARSEGINSSPEFEFNAPVEDGAPKTDLTAADELFAEGKIRPLKPPPRLHLLAMEDQRTSMSANSSPRSAKSWTLRSPHFRAKSDFDPFAAALAVATKDRGREEKVTPSHVRKVSRSLSPSPLSRGNLFKEKINPLDSSEMHPATETDSTGTGTSKSSSNKSRKKWRLSDLLLFRNGSEGRVAGNRSKDPIFKYSPSGTFNGLDSEKKSSEETKKRGGLGLKGMKGGNFFTKKGTTVSEKPQHAGKQVEEEKKKSQVPLRQGVFSCMHLNPSINRLARGINTYHLSKGK